MFARLYAGLASAPLSRGAAPSMDEESDAASESAKQKQLEAERAALQAEKAALELAALEVEAAKLKQLRPADVEPEVLPAVSLRVPGAVWPEPLGKYHRFVKEDDPTFEEYVNVGFGSTCATPSKFVGTTKEGVYPGSFRVQFTLPNSQPKTLEILQTTNDKSEFGAVKVRVPFTCDVQRLASDVDPSNSRLVAKRPSEDIQSRTSIKDGDFIRAVSLPDISDAAGDEAPEEASGEAPWWRRFTRIESRKLPESEEGMVILDGKKFADFYRVLEENVKVNEAEAEVVLIIERPGGGVQR